MAVNKSEIRSMIFNNLELVKCLLLTRNDLLLLNFVLEHSEVRPAMVAKLKGSSINNASTKLKKLFDQGYLQRREITNEAGGIEYLYSVSECIK
tara:strand:- start:158 stop:439 length:282 start_codon:yes stop_codon:yes gene_type:complete